MQLVFPTQFSLSTILLTHRTQLVEVAILEICASLIWVLTFDDLISLRLSLTISFTLALLILEYLSAKFLHQTLIDHFHVSPNNSCEKLLIRKEILRPWCSIRQHAYIRNHQQHLIYFSVGFSTHPTWSNWSITILWWNKSASFMCEYENLSLHTSSQSQIELDCWNYSCSWECSGGIYESSIPSSRHGALRDGDGATSWCNSVDGSFGARIDTRKIEQYKSQRSTTA